MQLSGELKQDVDWSGPVALEGDLVVPAGRLLRLAPGAELSFAARPRWSCSVFRGAPEGYPIEATSRRDCDIVVLGRLEARGARLAAEDGSFFGGVTLLGRGRAELRDCELAGAREQAVQCFDDSVLTLEGGVIRRSPVAVLGWGLARIGARGARFQDCGSAVLCREGAFARLEECELSRLSEGVWSQQWSLIEARRCRFEACSNFRAGAYERSRVTVDGAVVEKEAKLR